MHAERPIAAETDWLQIFALYTELVRRAPTPGVKLNRAVPVAMVDEPRAGLALLTPLEEELDGYHLFHTERADLLHRAGDADKTRAPYERALEITGNARERRYI